MLLLAKMASRRIETLSSRLTQKERAHRSTLDEVEQLQMQNAMLQILARSVDVPLAFPGQTQGGNIIFTITFKRGHGDKPEGILVEGDTVKLKDGMIFNVTRTDNS